MAERYRVVVNVEPRGVCTTDAESLVRLMESFSSEWLGVNMDTGNVFIAGGDPVAFLRQVLPWVRHVHAEDVAPDLAAAQRGALTGIATSHVAVGEGLLAEPIARCVELLDAATYRGTLSVECDAAGGPRLEASIRWVERLVASVGQRAAGC